MKVLLTVDTELWPLDSMSSGAPRPGLGDDYRLEEAIYFDGATQRGNFGIAYQLECLSRHNLKSSWFVEPMFSDAAGKVMLSRVIGSVLARGQEIGLHLHPEWLHRITIPGLPRRARMRIGDYPVEEQCALLKWGLARLAECGAPAITVFRAGNFGADRSTLAALRQTGIPLDSSFNAAIPASFPEIGEDRFERRAPELMDGVLEVPVSHFSTLAEAARPAQICACSAPEMEQALESAYRGGWPCFVILWHSGELVRSAVPAQPYAMHVRRFARMCQYLDDHRDRFVSAHFRDLLPFEPSAATTAPATVGAGATMKRVLEQVISRAPRLDQMLVP